MGIQDWKECTMAFANDVYHHADLTVGDNTHIGSHVTISQHTVRAKEGIGSGVLIGATSDIDPGTKIENDAFINFGTKAYGDRRMSDMEVMMAVRKMQKISKF